MFIHKDINGSELLGKIGSELTTKTQYVVARYFFLNFRQLSSIES